MLNVVYSRGEDELARVFVAELGDGSKIEFVESIQPPVPLDEKWVIIVSTLKGCPVGCPICDAGGDYRGKLSREEILAQIDHVICRRFPSGKPETKRLKVQFARMGEPSLNDAVLDVLEQLSARFDATCVMPSISTVAPRGCETFFSRLREIKNALYANGAFQMQLSLHSTDEQARRALVPIRTLSLAEMAALGDRFFAPGDRKVTLNFAPAKGHAFEPARLLEHFSPERFLIKLTPINPTRAVIRSKLQGLIDPQDKNACRAAVDACRALGYETLLSIGELRENDIGSNCGMYLNEAKGN